MNFLVQGIIFILLALIGIGDGVLFVVKGVHKIVVLLYKELLTVRMQIQYVVSSFFTHIKKPIRNTFWNLQQKLFAIHVPLRLKRPNLTIHKTALSKPKKPRQITIFSPFSFVGKLKYFIAGSLFSFIFFFLPLIIVSFLQDLPDPRIIATGQIPQTTKIYDRNGTLLYQLYASQNRTSVPLQSIPKHFQQATIAIEDKDFYRHPGFDVAAIIRSTVENLSGGDLQGGSTITQQLIKSTLLSPETSFKRKFKEIILAFWAERIYDKNQILEMYFNQIPYGGTAWGAQAASQLYFNKNVSDLNLAESAFLAGIPRAPTIYSPYGTTPNVWKKRQKEVLRRMVQLKYITNAQAQEAEKKELVFEDAPNSLRAPHFVMYMKDLLVKKYGLPMVEKGGLTVITSLDLPLQGKVQQIVSDEVTNSAFLNLSNGAALVTNPGNGDILAMVGSQDFHDPKDGNVNLTTSLRQPGSSIKVVTYAAALATKGVTAVSILDDTPITYTIPGSSPYSPVNYDGKFHGKVPLRIALANSYNIPAVKLLNQIGIPQMINLGKNMGITTWNHPENYGLSITLGAAETKMVDMATVYGVFANKGTRIDLNPILKVTDYKGTILEEKEEEPSGKRVLEKGVAFIISHILADNQARSLAFGPNSQLVIPNHTVSVKTGTSDSKRDNWAIGYTPSYVVATWVGNNDNSPMSQSLASGITGATPIWHRIMVLLLADTPDEKLIQPESIVTKPCMGRTEYFIKGTESSVNCFYRPPTVSPTSNQ